MCGRFVATTAPQQLALLFDAHVGDAALTEFVANYNVAPTTQVTTLVAEQSAKDAQADTQSDVTRVLRRAHWGLLPSWSKDRSRAASMINARSESLTEKPSFRPLLAAHRCAVLVDGYYEWRTVGVDTTVKQPKQPYFIRSPDSAPLAIAGLWTTWQDPLRNQAEVRSCSLITIAPNDQLAEIHDRMPCILDGDALDEWLDSPAAPLHVLQTADNDRLVAVTVATAVNNVRNKGAELIVPTTTTLF
jgi:putative SOS response-associated peptidase YedK